jgi:hypothetical protein
LDSVREDAVRDRNRLDRVREEITRDDSVRDRNRLDRVREETVREDTTRERDRLERVREDIAREELRRVVEYSSTKVAIDQDAAIKMLKAQGKLTDEGIQRFARNLSHFYSEIGKKELRDKLSLGPLTGTRDAGIEGKRFENAIAAIAENIDDIGMDLNKIHANFKVVDYATHVDGDYSRGKIYSIARGGPPYMLEKILRLFNLLKDEDNRRIFREMLIDLSEKKFLPKVGEDPTPAQLATLQEEFLKRAYLLVPSNFEDPLKVLILSQQHIPIEIRERMANAVTSDLKR